MDFSETTLLFFYSDLGPQSKKAKPEWEKIMNTGYAIDFVEYNCPYYYENPEVRSKYHIDGFPTMVLIKDNLTIKYKGCITETGVAKWLDSLDVPFYKPFVMK